MRRLWIALALFAISLCGAAGVQAATPTTRSGTSHPVTPHRKVVRVRPVRRVHRVRRHGRPVRVSHRRGRHVRVSRRPVRRHHRVRRVR